MKKKTSLKDIADSVGVSIALVSYVINNQKKGRIGKEITEKIRQAAARMNYHPNQIARSLKVNRTMTIGLIVADIANPFFSMLARFIENEADRSGYTVLFGSSDENAGKSKKLIDTFLNRQVDGLIISAPAGAESQLRELQEQEIPFVLVDRYFDGLKANEISLDNAGASAEATRHLVDKGIKKPGMINYESPLLHLKARSSGFLEALGNPGPDSYMLREISISNTVEETAAAVNEMLANGVDGIIFGTNNIAIAAMKHIITLPIDIPKDLSVISFDETEFFELYQAPLSFLRQPLDQIGRAAVELLVECIQGNLQNPRKEVFPAELVVRASTR